MLLVVAGMFASLWTCNYELRICPKEFCVCSEGSITGNFEDKKPPPSSNNEDKKLSLLGGAENVNLDLVAHFLFGSNC